jgi:hypothetical protein
MLVLALELDVDRAAKLGPTRVESDQNLCDGGERRVFRGLFDLLHVRSVDAGARG